MVLFLNRFVTYLITASERNIIGDESLTNQCDLKNKQASKQWLSTGFNRSIECKAERPSLNVMIVSWDTEGVAQCLNAIEGRKDLTEFDKIFYIVYVSFFIQLGEHLN